MYPILKPGTVVSIKQLQEYKESLTGCFITKEMAELSKIYSENYGNTARQQQSSRNTVYYRFR